jgi:hypothetical protein
MARKFAIRCNLSDERLAEALLETLGLEFTIVPNAVVTRTESYGGTRWELHRIAPGEFLLSFEESPTHRLFRDEKRNFGDVSDWFPAALDKGWGIQCREVSGRG